MGEWISNSNQEERAAPLSMPALVWRWLSSKGFTEAEAIQNLFQPSLKSLTHPFAISGMEKAVERLSRAFESRESLCVYADFDLDGTSGAALLHEGLKLLGFEGHQIIQPLRLSEGYGFHSHIVEDLADQGVKVIITVDVGITAIEAVQRAGDLGIDVILTDHHLPKEQLPEAYVVLNPNKGDCASGLSHLCGAGVAFYLLLALKMELKKRGLLQSDPDLRSILDCFVIGTLTDMVPLIAENRVLIKHGLKALENTKRPGLKVLLENLNLSGRELTSQEVAIRFAPKLNALSRMELGLRPIDVFTVEDRAEAETMIRSVLDANDLRVQLQQEAEQSAMEQLTEEQVKKDKFVWIWSKDFHKGVIGLVATRLSQTFGVPAFVGTLTEEGKIAGSGRSPDGERLNLLSLLQGAAEKLNRFGGHTAACGFELDVEHAEFLTEAFRRQLQDKDLSDFAPRVSFDVEAQLSEVDDNFMRWYSQLEPFGVGFESAKLKFSNLQLKALRALSGGKHYKLTFGDRTSSCRLDALWFSPPAQHPVMAKGLDLGSFMDIVAEPQMNHFAGRSTVQLILKDIRFAY